MGAGVPIHERAEASDALEAGPALADTSRGGDVGSADSELRPPIGGCDRLEEAGLSEPIRAFGEGILGISGPSDAGEDLAGHDELAGGELVPLVEAKTTAHLVASRTPGGEGRPLSRQAVTGQPTPVVAAVAVAEAPSDGAGGTSCRQGERSRSRSLDPLIPDTTRARDPRSRSRKRRQGRRVVQASPQEVQKAQLIRDRFPGFWPAEALSWAKKHTFEHLELCLRYVDVERQHRRIDNLWGYLREVFRSASPSSMKARIAKDEAQQRHRALLYAPRPEVPICTDTPAESIRSVLQHLVSQLRASDLHQRAPQLVDAAAASVEDLARALPEAVPMAALEPLEAELQQLDSRITDALAEHFPDQHEQARASAAAQLEDHQATMTPGAYQNSLAGAAERQLRSRLRVPRLASFFLEVST